METQSVQRRFSTLVKREVSPWLQGLGFEKHGLIYYRSLPGLSHLIALAKSRFSAPRELQFTVDVGIHVPGIVSTYVNRPEPAVPGIPDCCISARLGLLGKDQLDVWWMLRDPQSDISVITDLKDRLSRDGMPFLETLSSKSDVDRFLGNPEAVRVGVSPQANTQRLAYAGILRFLDGDRAAAADQLCKARELAKRGPLEEHIRELSRRLSDAK